MNCAEWQMRIAAESEESATAEHLAGCAECREFAHELAENRRALRTLVVDDAAVAALRARVMADVRARRTRLAWLWAAAPAAALAAIAAAVVAGWPSSPEPAPPPAVVYAPKPPDVPVRVERRETVVVRRRPPIVAAQALRMEIETSDPNVRIIWLVDEKGDSL